MRLNFGCGPVRPQGWCNVDPYPGDDRRRVIVAGRDDGLPWEPDTFDLAVAHHVLQMIPWPHLVPTLSEVRRVMKPGAVLRVTVPDLLGAFDAYDENRPGWFPIADEIEESIDGKFCVYLSQAGATRSVLTGPWLAELLSRAGFRDPIEYDEPLLTCSPHPRILDLDSRWDESTTMEATA